MMTAAGGGALLTWSLGRCAPEAGVAVGAKSVYVS